MLNDTGISSLFIITNVKTITKTMLKYIQYD